MEYVNLGKTGLKVSRICLGMMTYGTSQWREWVLDGADSRPIIQRAVELGVNFFDTADMYSLGVSEEVTGRALRDFARRDNVVIATKLFWPMSDDVNDRGLSRKHIMQAVDASLRRLQTDYIDLYQIHRFDPYTPIEETMEALHDVVKAGKARYIGASIMYAWQFAKMQYTADLHGWTRFVAMQNHYNLIYREEEREMIPYCIDAGVGVIPWSPLARGLLAGTRHAEKGKDQQAGSTTRARTDQYAHDMYYEGNDFEIVERVVTLAVQKDVRPAQVALAWMLHKPGITSPIIGASKIPHLEEADAALAVSLTAEDMAYLEAPYQPHPVLGHG